jgi:hypothetical protein
LPVDTAIGYTAGGHPQKRHERGARRESRLVLKAGEAARGVIVF